MECWNNGVMAPVKYKKVSLGKNDGFEGVLYNLNGLFQLLLPIFQHSILPFRWYKQVAIKRLVISPSRRILETSIKRYQ